MSDETDDSSNSEVTDRAGTEAKKPSYAQPGKASIVHEKEASSPARGERPGPHPWATLLVALVAAAASLISAGFGFLVGQEQNDIAADQNAIRSEQDRMNNELGLQDQALKEEQARTAVQQREADRKESLIQEYLPRILSGTKAERDLGIAALLSLMSEEEWLAVGQAIERVDPGVEDQLPDFFLGSDTVSSIDWAVNLGGYPDITTALTVRDAALEADISPVRIYERDGQVIIAIAPIDTESEAEIQLAIARSRLPNNASLVRLDTWCSSPRRLENPERFECVSQVPDVLGQVTADGKQALAEAGFTATVAEECTETAEAGRIYEVLLIDDLEQDDSRDVAGVQIEVGQNLILTVSTGPCTTDTCVALAPEADPPLVDFEGSDRDSVDVELDANGARAFRLNVGFSNQVMQVTLSPRQEVSDAIICIYDPAGQPIVATSSLQATTGALQIGTYRVVIAERGGREAAYSVQFIIPPA